MSQEVAAPQEASVPDLAPTSTASTATPEDLLFPTLYVAHSSSALYESTNAKTGDIIRALNADDPEAEVVQAQKDQGDGLLIFPLSWHKSWSLSDGGGNLQTWAFDDPARDPKARIVYNIVMAVPELDANVPFKMRFTGASTNAGKAIVTHASIDPERPLVERPYHLTTITKRAEGLAPWGVVQVVRELDPPKDAVKIARNLAPLAAIVRQPRRQTTDQPAI